MKIEVPIVTTIGTLNINREGEESQARIASGMTQKQLDDRIGVHAQQIQRPEANDTFRTHTSARGVTMTEIVTSQPTLISALDFPKGTLRERDRRNDILAEFLRLQISPQTQRLYATALEHFFQSITGDSALVD